MYALVWTEINGGRIEQAAALIRAFEPVAERTRHPGAQWALRNVQSSLTFLAGDIAGTALRLASEVEFGRLHGVPWSYVSQFQLGLCFFLQGRTDEALKMLRDAAAAEPPSWLGCHSRSVLFAACATRLLTRHAPSVATSDSRCPGRAAPRPPAPSSTS